MIDIERNIFVCNRLLNKLMKSEYGYDFTIRINQLVYLSNRQFSYRKYNYEIVYVRTNKTFNNKTLKILKDRVYHNINQILNVIECSDYRPVKNIKLKIIQ
jgi:hypothetical protein